MKPDEEIEFDRVKVTIDNKEYKEKHDLVEFQYEFGFREKNKIKKLRGAKSGEKKEKKMINLGGGG